MTEHATTSLTSDQSPTYPPMVFLQPTPEITTIDDAVAAYDDTELRYAVDQDMGEITWEPRRVPHTLISGRPGAGKFALTRTLLVDATRHGWEVVVIDLRSASYAMYCDWPNVSMVITEVEQAVAVIDHLHRGMGQRFRACTDDPSTTQVTPMLIVIDDYVDFTARLTRFYGERRLKGDPRECPTTTQVTAMLRLARVARMHLVLSIERPRLESLPHDVFDNLGHRVSLGHISPEHALLMWNSEKVGRHIPIGVPGRAIARNNSGEPVEVQCYCTPSPSILEEILEDDPQLRRIAEQLRPSVSLYPRKVVAPPTPVDDEDGPVPFSHFQDAGIHLAVDRPDLDPLAPRHRS